MKTHATFLLAALAILGGCSDSDSDGTPATDPNGDAVPVDPVDPAEPGDTDMSGTPTDGTDATPDAGAPDGDDGSVAPTGDVVAFGTLSGSYDELDDATEWNAQFFRSSVPFPFSALDESVVGPAPADTCTVLESAFPDVDTDVDLDFDNLDFVPETVSAGESIVLTAAPGNTYTTLTGETFFGFLIYRTTDDVPVAGPIPDGLTATIEGSADGFPAFDGVTVPTAAPVSFTLEGSTLAWTGAGASGGRIDLLFGVVTDGDVLGTTFVECDLVDDGSHEIAGGVLPTGDLVEFPVFVGTRSVTSVERNGNAVLILMTETEGFLAR